MSAVDLSSSNSLADLATRIKIEHQAVGVALTHAIKAGELLIEAKGKVPHGEWLSWLETNCDLSERTAQAYMRVARELGKLEPAKAQRVADLSVRDALKQFSRATTAAKLLSPEKLDQAIEAVEAGKDSCLVVAMRKIARSGYSLETPRSMLPTPTGRKIRVARNAKKRQWLLAIGPNVSRAALKEKEKAARETAAVQQLQQEHDDLLNRAAALDAEAEALRKEAGSIQRDIADEIEEAVGRAAPLSETYDFQCDEDTDAELAAVSQDRLVDMLLAARGSGDGGLVEIKRGYWGDMSLMPFSQQISPGPSIGWTGIGSPEWLGEMFPDWNEDGTAS